jgi:hypothetical protein
MGLPPTIVVTRGLSDSLKERSLAKKAAAAALASELPGNIKVSFLGHRLSS